MKDVKRPLYTRKHYEDAALSLLPGANDHDERMVIAKFLIGLFEPDNENFDEVKFLKAAKIRKEHLKD